MLTKSQIKYIQSLHQKKYRELHGVFIAEGEKIVDELLRSDYTIELIAATSQWQGIGTHECIEVETFILEQISALQTPNKVLAVVKKKTPRINFNQDYLHLYLDELKDPGNIGTIIRSAEWFGLKHIYLSPQCVEAYNPKVIQASMGSFFRMEIHEISIEELIRQSAPAAVYGATITGNNIRETDLKPNAVLVIGSESHGISDTTLRVLNQEISIPAYGSAESLNASIAGSVLLYEFAARFKR